MITGCSPSGLLEIEVVEFSETDHWTGNGNRACTVHYKLLNNSGHTVNQLSVTMAWHDSLDRPMNTIILLTNALPSNAASRTTTTDPIFGRCSEISFQGFRDVLRCNADPLIGDACAERLTIKFTAPQPTG